jgi:hypothetical protein
MKINAIFKQLERGQRSVNGSSLRFVIRQALLEYPQ